LSAYILPLSACTHPLGHSALTHLSHTAHSLPLVCAFPLLNSALTHVHFALNLPHTTLNTHPLSAHIPSALTQLTHTAHSSSQLTHRALTQHIHDLRCRVIRDERQLALGVHCLTTVCTHPHCTHPPCCRKRYDQYDLFRLIYDFSPRLNPFVFFISPFFIRQCSHKLNRHVQIEEGCLKAAPAGGH
jgi:hypothetical protein